MEWLLSLLSNDEVAADSVVFCTFIAELALIIFSGVSLWHDPSTFSPINFATASATIIGAGAGVKTCRERWGNRPQ